MSLKRNFLALSLIQVSNYVLPVLTFPWLIRVLGLSVFGELQFALAVITYFVILTDYGYNLTATRKASLWKEDLGKIRDLYAEIFSARLLLLLGSALLLALFLWISGAGSEKWLLFTLTFLLVPGQMMQPLWLFQGLEKMGWITLYHFVGRLLYAGGVFVFVKSSNDWHWVAILWSLSSLLSGFLASLLAWRLWRCRPYWIGIARVWNSLKESFAVFLSGFSVNSYTNAGILILQWVGTAEAVGAYAFADRLVQLLRQVLSMFFQIVYPRVCQLAETQMDQMRSFVRKMSLLPIAGLLAYQAFLFLFGKPLLGLLLKSDKLALLPLVQLSGWIPFCIALNIPAFLALVSLDKRVVYTPVLLSGAGINVVLTYVLSSRWGADGTVWALILTEGYIAIMLHLRLWQTQKEASVFSL